MVFPIYYDTQEENSWRAGPQSYFVTLEGKTCEVKGVITVVETPHEHAMEYNEEFIPICGTDEEGYKAHYVCYLCDRWFEDEAGTKELGEEDIVIHAKDEHSFGDWETFSEPTEDTTGLKIRICTVCGFQEEEEIPVSEHTHTWGEGEEIKAATCTEKGEKTYTCTVCGETKTDEIPALGHKWGNWNESSSDAGIQERECSTCHEKETRRKAGWQSISGKWYYFDGSGVMQTSWQKIGGKWYYFNGSGVMQTDWQKISGKWYYFNSSGAMQTGWQKIGGKWYYFNGSGVMQTGTVRIGGKRYRFNSSGVWIGK